MLQPSWEVDLILLFSHLAEHNIGYVDWEPVTPLMFSKFLHSFGLPVCYRCVALFCEPYINLNLYNNLVSNVAGANEGKLATSSKLERWSIG